TGQPITIYGNGKQVRDVLFIEDLTELFLALARNIECFSGETFNVGGGPENTISLLEFIEALEDILGKKIPYGFADARVGDQPIYISDIRKVTSMTGWSPKNTVKGGVIGLIQWVKENENLFLEHQAAQHS
ncbi:MAG: NAD-dependent epimerase/dehydratase family protein, partial [Pseudomonadota bacterium]|nr:NAD-dependent epimerase/dehydratase family protein [Pseudomonadota bacterium]